MINDSKTKEKFGYDSSFLNKRIQRNYLKKYNNAKTKGHLSVVDNCPKCGKERIIQFRASKKNLPCAKCIANDPVKREILSKFHSSRTISEKTREKMRKNHWSKKGGIPWQKGKPFSKEAKLKMIETNIKRGHIKGVLYKDKVVPMSYLSKMKDVGYEKIKIWMKNNKNPTQKEIDSFLELAKQKNETNIENIVHNLFNIDKFDKFLSNLKYKPDFELIKDSVYLNTDGLYWHSEYKQKDKYYHYNMRKDFELQNKRILQIRENEIFNKKHIVESIILNILNKTPHKKFARTLAVQKIKNLDAKKFLLGNHLMGYASAKHVGLVDKNGTIYSLMSYKIFKGRVLKIERFCSLVKHNIVGGFNKLLSFIEKEEVGNYKEIHNWVDLRYGTGAHLIKKGFILEKETLGWQWTDLTNTYNRRYCMANMEGGLSEKECAQKLNLVKIYDAGQRLYKKIF